MPGSTQGNPDQLSSHALLSRSLAGDDAKPRLEAHALLAEQLLGLGEVERGEENAEAFDLAVVLQCNFQEAQGTDAHVLARQRVGERTEEYRDELTSPQAKAIAGGLLPNTERAETDGYQIVNRRR